MDQIPEEIATSSASRSPIGSCSTGDREAYQADLVERIQGLLDEVQTLKNRHNAVAPIYRLPPEVLAKIFAAAYWDIRAVSRVCSYWRETALGYPNLWRAISFSYPIPTIATMLDRSEESPLEVYLADEPSTAWLIRALCLTFSDLHRLRVFDMKYSAYDYGRYRDVFSARANVQAPVLELHLENGAHHIHGVPNYLGLPDNFLSGGAPSLAKLTLVGCKIPWEKVPLGPSLTRLHLEHNSGDGSIERPSLASFLDSLRSIPLLEEIRLGFYLPHHLLPAQPITPPLSLSNLCRLEINDLGPYIFQFFHETRFYNLRMLHIADFWTGQDESSHRRTFQCIKASLGEEHRFCTGTGPLSLRMETPHTFRLIYDPKLLEEDLDKFRMTFGSDNISVPQCFSILDDTFHLKGIESFTVRAQEAGRVRDNVWEFAGRLTGLKHIAIDRSGIRRLASFFWEIRKDIRELFRYYDFKAKSYNPPLELDAPWCPRFPALSSITCTDFDFIAEGTKTKESVIKDIANTLWIREVIQYPIEKLHIILYLGDFGDVH